MDCNFYFYFPTEIQAQPFAEKLRGDGFQVTVRPGATGDAWLLLANKDVSEEELDELEERFGASAAEMGAEYDGYERAAD